MCNSQVETQARVMELTRLSSVVSWVSRKQKTRLVHFCIDSDNIIETHLYGRIVL